MLGETGEFRAPGGSAAPKVPGLISGPSRPSAPFVATLLCRARAKSRDNLLAIKSPDATDLERRQDADLHHALDGVPVAAEVEREFIGAYQIDRDAPQSICGGLEPKVHRRAPSSPIIAHWRFLGNI